jgi:hypothetical protein
MALHIHSDTSYLSEAKSCSRAGGTFFLNSLPKDPTATPNPNLTPPPFNGAIHVDCSNIQAVVSSATEATLGTLFYNVNYGTWFRTTLKK